MMHLIHSTETTHLVIHQLEHPPVFFPLLGNEVLIGRLDTVDISLDSAKVSRVHAKIVRKKAAYMIVDLESTVGTLVNKKPIDRHYLKDGDIIRIATIELEYRE